MLQLLTSCSHTCLIYANLAHRYYIWDNCHWSQLPKTKVDLSHA